MPRFLCMRLLFVVLLLAACSNEPAKVDNALDQALPHSLQPSVPDNAVAPAASEPVPRVDAGSAMVPTSFIGRWTGEADNCADRAAALELEITPDALIFHESVGTVKTVQPDANGRIAIQADFTGEGESWTRTLLLRPSTDGQRLTITNDGAAVTRKRCAEA